jgi:hypothetical protein
MGKYLWFYGLWLNTFLGYCFLRTKGTGVAFFNTIDVFKANAF